MSREMTGGSGRQGREGRAGRWTTVISIWNIMLASARCEVMMLESKAGDVRKVPSRLTMVFFTASCACARSLLSRCGTQVWGKETAKDFFEILKLFLC